MASNFVNTTTSILAGGNADVYTVPASTSAIVIGFQIANKGTATADASVTVNGVNLIGTNTPIPIDSALIPIEGKLNLVAADVLNVAATGADVDVILSVLELT